MVISLYNKKEEQELRRVKKDFLKYAVVVFVIGVVICGLLCLFVRENNARFLQISCTMLGTVTGWYVLFIYLNDISPLRSRLKYLTGLQVGVRQKECGKVESITEAITIRKHILVYQLQVTVNGVQKILYWDAQKALPDILHKEVCFEMVQHKVISYEVMEKYENMAE